MVDKPTDSCRVPERRNRNAFFLLFLLIATIYSNTLMTEWHFDDIGGILKSSQIQIEDLSFKSISRTFFRAEVKNGKSELSLYRPISNLSLALNWYFGKDKTVGYHLVNIAIHILTAFFLFLSIRCLFRTPVLRGRPVAKEEYFIALLSASLWAVNPIQTQAVSYIIQRMAAMAALFSILGTFLYLKGRLSSGWIRRGGYFLGCAIALLLAVGSKENAAVWPVSLVLVEVAFFRNIHTKNAKRVVWLSAAMAALLVILAGQLFLGGNIIDSIWASYENRPFSPWERLMTEGRILIYYLSLIYYPVPTRLSIEHDVVISTSMFHPWQTLPSIGLVFFLVGFGAFLLKKRPLIGFCILYFFVNHAVESTIFGLELLFEHRNYMPSFFLFVPVALGIRWVLDHYQSVMPGFYRFLSFFVILLIVGLGTGTYIRNRVWISEKALWMDAFAKAPRQDRPAHNLGIAFYNEGNYEEALKLYKMSLQRRSDNRRVYDDITLTNMASIFYRTGQFDLGLETSRKAVEINPENTVARYNLVFHLIQTNHLAEALRNADILVNANPLHDIHQYVKGLVLLNMERPRKAIIHLDNALLLHPNFSDALLPAGIAYSQVGQYGRAVMLINRAEAVHGHHILTALGLIEAHLKAGNTDRVKTAATRLLKEYSISEIFNAFSILSKGHSLIPLSWRMLIPPVLEAIKDKGREIETLGFWPNE